MKWIKLSNDPRSFCIDDEDYGRVKLYNWYLSGNDTVISAWVGLKKINITRFIVGGQSPEKQIDHKDRNILNNCRVNYRFCTQQQNIFNRRFKNSSSKYQGVRWDAIRGRWEAYLNVNGRRVYFERFLTEIEAARARDKAAKKYHGEFAFLNFPDE